MYIDALVVHVYVYMYMYIFHVFDSLFVTVLSPAQLLSVSPLAELSFPPVQPDPRKRRMYAHTCTCTCTTTLSDHIRCNITL